MNPTLPCVAIGLALLVGQLSTDKSPSPDSPRPADASSGPSSYSIYGPSDSTNNTSFTNYYADPLLRPHAVGKIATLVVDPSTIREGFNYRRETSSADHAQGRRSDTAALSTVTLTGPANEAFVCRVTSSAPDKVKCSDVIFSKGVKEAKGTVMIDWDKIARDCRVQLRVTDPHDSTISAWFAVSLRKNPSDHTWEEKHSGGGSDAK